MLLGRDIRESAAASLVGPFRPPGYARAMPPTELFPTLPDGAGRIGLLSSDEFLEPARPFEDVLLADAGIRRIGVVLCADHAAAPQSLGFAERRFRGDGIEVLDVPSGCAPTPLPEVDLLYLAGGNPRELLGCVRSRDGWWEQVLDRWRAGMHLAGSSAGAMALCADAIGTCTCVDPTHEWGPGLGPVTGVGLAVHADRRDPAWLAGLPASAPVPVVAMDEATGVILEPGRPSMVVGPGRVWALP